MIYNFVKKIWLRMIIRINFPKKKNNNHNSNSRGHSNWLEINVFQISPRLQLEIVIKHGVCSFRSS